MDDLLAARWQMGLSLGFHILFAVAGMAMPAFMVLAEWRYQRTGESSYLELAQRWAKGTAILFAVGAVSGTVLSFELGLLWPRFMQSAGPLIGMPFSLEGFAFFLEAIAIGIYLYGWQRVPPNVHLGSGVVVAVSGLFSGVFVVAVNAWMNTPRGFDLAPGGGFTNVQLWDAFFTPAFPTQAVHMALAAYASIAFAVLGIHAYALRKNPDDPLHQAALRIVIPIAAISAILQAVSGDLAAKHLAEYQPAKLAAAEGLFHTEAGAPLAIGGLPDPVREETTGAIFLPKMLSVMARGDPDAIVTGLDAFPKSDWPNVPLVHLSFQVMVFCGGLMILLMLWAIWLRLRKRPWWHVRSFLTASVAATPLGLIALEAGWMVTELGRQPWIISGILRVEDAVTPMPGLWISLVVSILIYLFLGGIVALLLWRYVRPPSPGTIPQEAAEDPQ